MTKGARAQVQDACSDRLDRREAQAPEMSDDQMQKLSQEMES